jgi:hypothetical protein
MLQAGRLHKGPLTEVCKVIVHALLRARFLFCI